MADPTYVGSDRIPKPIRDLATPYLGNTLRQMADGRKGEQWPGQRAALQAEFDSRPPPDSAPAPVRNEPAAMGDNSGEVDVDLLVITERIAEHIPTLDKKHKALWDEAADLELASFALPREVKTEDEAQKITAHVGKEKKLAAKLESTRKAEKEPFLDAGRKVDARFAIEYDPLVARSKSLTSRLDAYQQAKAAAAEAERRQKAAAAAKAAQEAEQRANDERKRAAEAAAAAETAARKVREAQDEAAREAAKEELRQNLNEAQLSTAAADQAEKDIVAAERHANTQERIADRGGLGRTAADGASANVQMVDHIEIDFRTVRLGMGVIGSYVAEESIRKACETMAKLGVELPAGVVKTKVPKTNVRVTK